MTGAEYQNNILNYNVSYPENLGAFCSVLLMQQEIGKLSNTLVKILSKPDASITEEERHIFAIQLGELLMNLTRTAFHCGLSLDSVMQYNIDLHNRQNSIQNIKSRDILKKGS